MLGDLLCVCILPNGGKHQGELLGILAVAHKFSLLLMSSAIEKVKESK